MKENLNERLHAIWCETLLSSLGTINTAVTYVYTGTVFRPTATDLKVIWNFSIKSIQAVVGDSFAYRSNMRLIAVAFESSPRCHFHEI